MLQELAEMYIEHWESSFVWNTVAHACWRCLSSDETKKKDPKSVVPSNNCETWVLSNAVRNTSFLVFYFSADVAAKELCSKFARR